MVNSNSPVPQTKKGTNVDAMAIFPMHPQLPKSSFQHIHYNYNVVKLGSRSKVYLKSLIRDLDLELAAIIAMSPTHQKTFLSTIKLKSLHV